MIRTHRPNAAYVSLRVLLAIGAVFALGLGSFCIFHFRARHVVAVLDPGLVYTITPVDMSVRILQDGELQAVNNLEIKNRVESRTTILTVVPEGASVKKGDTLLTLDSSNIRQRIEDIQLSLQRAEASLMTAQEQVRMQESQNDADLEAASVALDLARIDLKRYLEGTFPQQVQTATADTEIAAIKLQDALKTLSMSRRLFEKQFVTATAVKADQLSTITAQNAVNRADTSLMVLTKYMHEKNLASKTTAVSQAEQRLERTRRINASNLAQRNAELKNREQVVRLVKRRLQRWQDQLAACTIIAPTDGLVIYGSTGNWNASSSIQAGNSVWQEQLLFRLPDTRSMKAVVRVREAVVPRLRVGMPAKITVVGVDQPMLATLSKISILPDSAQRFANPDLRIFAVELTLNDTPSGLKPGESLTAEILTDQLHGVNAVPLSAIHYKDDQSVVFVTDGQQVEPRLVQVGQVNEEMAQITDESVKAGERVLKLDLSNRSDILARTHAQLSALQARSKPLQEPAAETEAAAPRPVTASPTKAG
jgi:HlyD family secretion protein